MSATIFDALNEVIVHANVPFDSSTLDAFRAESFLLMQSVNIAGTYDQLTETDINGELVYDCYYNFQVRYSIESSALALAGLANYHPGANLATQDLEFLNGGRSVFQIPLPDKTKPNGRRLIYENPKQSLGQGKLIDCSFDIVSKFGSSSIGNTVPPLPDLVSGLVPEVSGGSDYADFYGKSVIWIRRLDLTGPETNLEYVGINGDYWFAAPMEEPAPADLATFLADHHSNAENLIAEVFATDAPGGRSLRIGDGIITDHVSAGLPLPALSPYPGESPVGYDYVYGCSTPSEGYRFFPQVGPAIAGSLTLAEDIMRNIQITAGDPADPMPVAGVGPWQYTSGDGPVTVLEIYDFRSGQWLSVPPPP